jgi:hypothetical protein
VVGTGGSGGGNALLIILGGAIVLAVAYICFKKWRRGRLGNDGDDDLPVS